MAGNIAMGTLLKVHMHVKVVKGLVARWLTGINSSQLLKEAHTDIDMYYDPTQFMWTIGVACGRKYHK